MEELILNFLKKKNLQVSTKTKARGHLGFYCNEKITISKNLSDEKKVQVLLHEFAHKIHSEIEPNKFQSGGSLEKIFQTEDVKIIEDELLKVTNFVDENSRCLALEKMKKEYKDKVASYENEIKKEFPNFAKSKKFKEYDKYQRKTHCKSKYFLKYDHIKIVTPIFFRTEFFTIEKLDEDFPDLPSNFKNYFRLLSNYRKQKKIQNKISALKRYYKKPTELFARFVEGLVKNEQKVKELAPVAFSQFENLAARGYYNDLPQLLNVVKNAQNIGV